MVIHTKTDKKDENGGNIDVNIFREKRRNRGSLNMDIYRQRKRRKQRKSERGQIQTEKKTQTEEV